MAKYMLLLYAPPADTPEVVAEREASLPLWMELNESLEKAGLLVASGRLESDEAATTLRIREGETEITDGPFALTKEVLGGYYILECRDLDEALKHAARVPLAKFGSVEVRPLMENPLQRQAPQDAAATSA